MSFFETAREGLAVAKSMGLEISIQDIIYASATPSDIVEEPFTWEREAAMKQ